MSLSHTEKILLVDDDVELTDMLASYFGAEGFDVVAVGCREMAWQALSNSRPDLLVLDLMLPDGNGLHLCRRIRADDAALPVLILTARGDPLDRVLGLELGADDYLSKPFEPRELLARVRALLRRASVRGEASASHIVFGQFELNLNQRQLHVGPTEIALTTIEFKLLCALLQTPNRAVSRQALAAAVQPGSYRPLDRAVDVQVTRLRKKLREAAHGRDVIHTVRGEGYALIASGAPARRMQ
jgi:DNA-binding response OmpR family regulator